MGYAIPVELYDLITKNSIRIFPIKKLYNSVQPFCFMLFYLQPSCSLSTNEGFLQYSLHHLPLCDEYHQA